MSRLALDAAAAGPVAEGSVGGGTETNCNEFKGRDGHRSPALQHDRLMALLSHKT
jgi:L-aminopeptidase/D-esterase-like protein